MLFHSHSGHQPSLTKRGVHGKDKVVASGPVVAGCLQLALYSDYIAVLVTTARKAVSIYIYIYIYILYKCIYIYYIAVLVTTASKVFRLLGC